MNRVGSSETKSFLDTLVASLLAIGFIVFLVLMGSRAGMSFDASYNLVSYQNLFDGKGFVYDYAGKHIPFDPAISTGPELYLPVLAVWKVTGHSGYAASVYVVIAYYALYLGFLIFYVLKTSSNKTFSVFGFILLFLCSGSLFSNQMAVIPLGEIAACFLGFCGIFLLSRKKLAGGFVLLGLALDLKTNVIVALVPVVALFLVSTFIIAQPRGRKWSDVFKTICRPALLSLLIFVPHVISANVAPALVLGPHEATVHYDVQKERFRFEKRRAFAQIADFKDNFNRVGFSRFASKVKEKITLLKDWQGENYLSLALFGILLIFFILFSHRERHYAFYLFSFSFFIALWWIAAPYDAWYRYFLPAQFMFLIGIVSLIPSLMEEKKIGSFIIVLAVLMLFVPQFSSTAIKGSLDATDKQNMMKMKDYIQHIDGKDVFAYGWFQNPQLMLLTGKRFQDFTDKRKIADALRSGKEIFLLTSVECLHYSEVKKEVESATKNFALVKEYGNNRLYRIR